MLDFIIIFVCLLFASVAFAFKFLHFGATCLTVLFFLIISIAAPDWWIILTMIGYAAIFSATAYKHEEKELIRGTKYQNVSRRSYTSILGKVLVPAVTAVFNMPGFFVSAILFGVADSFANEIGVLSPNWPRLIITGKKVAPGTNGGVSVLGTIAAIISSVLVGFIALGLSRFNTSFLYFLPIAAIIGLLGCMIDSFFGATLENRGMISGWFVNLISGIVAGMIGSQLFSLLHF